MTDHLDWKNEQNACLKKVMSNTDNVEVRSAVIKDKDKRDNLEYTYFKWYKNNEHPLCNENIPHGELLEDISIPF